MSLDPRLRLIQHLTLAATRSTCTDSAWIDDAEEHVMQAAVELQRLRWPNRDPVTASVAKVLKGGG